MKRSRMRVVVRIVLQDQTLELPGDVGTSEDQVPTDGQVRVISIVVMVSCQVEGRNEC